MMYSYYILEVLSFNNQNTMHAIDFLVHLMQGK